MHLWEGSGCLCNYLSLLNGAWLTPALAFSFQAQSFSSLTLLVILPLDLLKLSGILGRLQNWTLPLDKISWVLCRRIIRPPDQLTLFLVLLSMHKTLLTQCLLSPSDLQCKFQWRCYMDSWSLVHTDTPSFFCPRCLTHCWTLITELLEPSSAECTKVLVNGSPVCSQSTASPSFGESQSKVHSSQLAHLPRSSCSECAPAAVYFGKNGFFSKYWKHKNGSSVNWGKLLLGSI